VWAHHEGGLQGHLELKGFVAQVDTLGAGKAAHADVFGVGGINNETVMAHLAFG
jgi:hypothetical protein